MVFSSVIFIFYYLVLVLLAYYLAPKRFRNLVLLCFSLFFYFYGEKQLVVLLIFSIVFNYFYAKLIEQKHNPWILALGVGVNVALLFYFKYANFFIDNLNRLFNFDIRIAKIVLPIGISFFTFQGLSYLVDVYRGDVKANKSLINFGTYLSLFPQLIAGPIVRYETVAEELENRQENIDDFARGIKRFLIGLFKKIVLANMFGEAVKILGGLTTLTVVSTWLEAIFATFQLYFDFSAYSDMAIGMGLFFGFHFLENFNYPLIASSVTDFWRRWHMSLSSWFKDYVYIPLGGSRKGTYRQYFNIAVVWFLTGFWHGADWNFMFWGLFFAVILVIEKRYTLGYLKKYPIFGTCLTFVIVVISFVIFNHSSLADIILNLKTMFGMEGAQFIGPTTWYYTKSYFVLLIVGFIGMTPLCKNLYAQAETKYPALVANLDVVLVLGALVITTAYLLDASFNPFLYFRF